jgi:hypothetical protein
MAIRGWLDTLDHPFAEIEKSLRPDGDDFAAVIMATGAAHIVGTLEFTAVGAFLERFDAQRIVATAHTALGGGRFPFGDSHIGTLFRKSIRLCERPDPT